MNTKNWIERSQEGLICSPSGWRKILSSETSKSIHDHDLLFYHYAILSYLIVQQKLQNRDRLRINLACDTRKSSPELLSLARFTLRREQQNPHVLGLLPIPAALAYTAMKGDGLIYITASHNPKHYNGVKFCTGDGSVVSPEIHRLILKQCTGMLRSAAKKEHHELLHSFRKTQKYHHCSDIVSSIPAQTTHAIQSCYAHQTQSAALRGLVDVEKQIRVRAKNLRKAQLCPALIWDANGGARSWSSDAQILRSYGISMLRMNTRPGNFAHEIIPEGSSLKMASEALMQQNTAANAAAQATANTAANTAAQATANAAANTAANTAAQERPLTTATNKKQRIVQRKSRNTGSASPYFFAMISDCDGDRGNTVLYDFTKQRTVHLSAQEVFSLVLNIELAWERYISQASRTNTGAMIETVSTNRAVVVNDASSLRVEAIAERYQVAVFRSEVGEVNVLTLAEELRQKDYYVPLSGEASNGGVILHPSSVRDPICTSLSFLKACLFFDELYPELVQKRKNRNPLITILQQMPTACSTALEDPLAKLQLGSMSVSTLMSEIVSQSKSLHTTIQSALKDSPVQALSLRMAVHSGKKKHWIQSGKGASQRKLKGGFSLYLLDDDRPFALLWLRSSATEPVLRIMADVMLGRQSKKYERILIRLWNAFLQKIISDGNRNALHV